MREYLVDMDDLRNKREEEEDTIAEARELTREYLKYLATIAEAREYLASLEAEGRVDAGVLGGNVEIDAVGERESDAINQNLENKKEEDMTDD